MWKRVTVARTVLTGMKSAMTEVINGHMYRIFRFTSGYAIESYVPNGAKWKSHGWIAFKLKDIEAVNKVLDKYRN